MSLILSLTFSGPRQSWLIKGHSTWALTKPPKPPQHCNSSWPQMNLWVRLQIESMSQAWWLCYRQVGKNKRPIFEGYLFCKTQRLSLDKGKGIHSRCSWNTSKQRQEKAGLTQYHHLASQQSKQNINWWAYSSSSNKNTIA